MKEHEAGIVAQLLQRIQRLLGDHTAHLPEKWGIPMGTLIILRKIGDAPGITVSELSRQVGLSKGYVSVQVNEVEEKGLLRKLSDPHDQRCIRLELTTQGAELGASLQQEYHLFISRLMAAVPTSEIPAIITGLQQVKSALESPPSQ